jgi:hypothetical protein
MATAIGCGGSSLSGGGFATTPDQSVLTPAVVKVTLTSKGGGLSGGGQCSAAGVCVGGVFSYTLSLDTKRLAFNGSVYEGNPPMWVPVMDDVGLSASQLETLTGAARAVTVSAKRDCGADASDRELTVESATGALTYGDDFYGCLTTYDQFVTFDGLNNLQTAFAAVAP